MEKRKWKLEVGISVNLFLKSGNVFGNGNNLDNTLGCTQKQSKCFDVFRIGEFGNGEKIKDISVQAHTSFFLTFSGKLFTCGTVTTLNNTIYRFKLPR